MRRSLIRVAGVLILAAAASLCLPAPAQAGEDRAVERKQDGRDKQIVRGLQAGIKALRVLGGNENLIARLEELIAELKRASVKRGPKRAGEQPKVGQMAEVMTMAHRSLRAAGQHDQAVILEHSIRALKMLASGRTDEEALEILSSAPSGESQARALFAAAEVLGDQGERKPAARCAALARTLADKRPGKAQGREPEREHARKQAQAQREAVRRQGPERAPERAGLADPERGLDGLRERLSILRLAGPALREAGRRDLLEMLERAVHTGELLLEGRQDEEAQRIYRNTPGLIDLSTLLHAAARLWLKYEQPAKAEALARLSRYYRERAAQEEEEAEEEEKEDEPRERAEQQEREEEGEQEAREARRSSWALRQQAELEQRRQQAREQQERAERRREHEQRMRAEAAHPPGRPRPPAARDGDKTAEEIEQLRRELQELQRAVHELMRELRGLTRQK